MGKQRLKGNWKKGVAYDLHTLRSEYLGDDERGHPQFNTTRSDMGELVYRLKYNGDQKALPKIVRLLDAVKGIEKADIIVPVPSSDKSRKVQPVVAIADALGGRRGVTVVHDLLIKTGGGPQLKNVGDPDERMAILREHMTINKPERAKGQKILLVDDLYRSGATLAIATDILYEVGKARSVKVLTMTRTRSNR